MVGLVLVSHSKKLAEAVRELVLQMTAPDFPVAVAGGVGDTHDELGTDAVHISEVLQSLHCPEGVLVLMDLGSAVLSAQTALELLEPPSDRPIRLCPAPLVEGAIAAAVRAQAGGSLDEVATEAELGLAPKQQQLGVEPAADLTSAATQPLTGTPDEAAEAVLDITNQHGLHARPAAALVQTASRFSGSVEVWNLTQNRGPASARSLTSLSLLQVRKGDRIKVVCHGPDCEPALAAIRQLSAIDFGDKPDAAPATPATKASGARGFPGADGIAIGTLAMLQPAELIADDHVSGDPATEMAALTAAMKAAGDEVQRARRGGNTNDILEAQALILSDPIVETRAREILQSGDRSASQAWIEIMRELAAQYEALDDPYLRERAADVRDIARRVLRQLQGDSAASPVTLDAPAVLFTIELLPSEASACDPEKVLGVITAKGSATAHSAILLRTLGIPMIVGATGITASDAGKTVALDGSTGEFWIDPKAEVLARLQELKEAGAKARQQAELARTQPSLTLDGTRIQVLANVGNPRDSALAAENGAEGVGLLRTEFLFVAEKQAPGEDEQARALREMYQPLTGPLTVRTLDVGADKPLSFLPQPEEHNPYLGVRGIRLSLRSQQLFLSHLRAILRSGVGHDIWLMFPMISVVQEVQDALRLLQQAHQQLLDEKADHAWPIKRGIMIEVPAAALLAEKLADNLDFFSIGTNDLTQYTMAAERGNANVAELQDALHPAVLRLMRQVVEGAKPRHCHVSVCGDAASDAPSAAVFAGLGIHSLSVRPNQAASIKALFRGLELAELERIAAQALKLQNAAEVRRLIGDYLQKASRETSAVEVASKLS